MNRLLWAIAVVAASVCSVTSSADARTRVFNTFGKHGTSNPGWCITGPATANCGPNVWRSVAAPFIPSRSGTLDSVDIAVGYSTGTRGVVVTLVRDSTGAPSISDPILESWTLVDEEFVCCGAKLHEALVSVVHPALAKDVKYWLVVSPLGFDSLSGWQKSPTSTAGYDASFNGGTTWSAQTGNTPAFAVWIQ